jgi:drug/metabolite transporter (DMT)-like permease
VLQRSLLQRYSALHLTTWSIWVGTLMLLIFLPKLPGEIRHASWQMTTAVAYLGVFPAAAGYVMWNYALSKMPVSRVASFAYLVPVVATALGFFLLGELPTKLSLCGVPAAIAGVYLVNRKGRIKANVERRTLK